MVKKLLTALLIFCSLYNARAQWINIGSLTGTGANYPCVSVVNDSVVWFAGGNSGVPVIFRSTNNGSSFLPVNVPPCFEITCINALSADECFAGDGGSSGSNGGNAKLFRTTNAGLSWVLINQTGGTNGFFLDIVFSKVNPSSGVAVSNPPAGLNQPYYLLKTNNGGNNWIVENPPAVSGSNGIWHCVIIYDASAYGFGISGGFFPRITGTTDGGSSWSVFPILMSGNPIASFAYSDVNTIALASTSSVVARTTDQGLSWQTVNTGGALCIRWIPGTDISYFLSGSIIKKSTDEGATWNSMTIAGVTGLKHFDFAKSGNNIYGFGISGSGTVIKLTESITGIKPVNNNIPGRFRLYQNYPNPFNPVTKISFQIPLLRGVSAEGDGLPATGRGVLTKLQVFDILGREVRTLVNDVLNPGTYEITFDASGLSSGAYYYKLTAGEPSTGSGGQVFTDTKKMLLIK